jgi:repressor LexA
MTPENDIDLTPRQRQVYEFIKANSAYFGPAIREIASGLSIRSPNGVACHLNALERKGYISRRRGVARGIEVTK